MKGVWFMLMLAIISMGPDSTFGAIYVLPDPIPCSTAVCTALCKQVECGNYKCPGGYCVNNPKVSRNLVCLCTPRPNAIPPISPKLINY